MPTVRTYRRGPTVGNRLATEAASSVERHLGWTTRGQPEEVDATLTAPEACHALDCVDVMVIQTQPPHCPRSWPTNTAYVDLIWVPAFRADHLRSLHSPDVT